MEKITKSSTDKVFSGVCGGVAEFFNVSPFLVRVLFIFIPGSLTVYIILALLLPKKLHY
ncbi:PspC domain-containing protein [Sporosarcina sp. NPDC096371]|uniref:PspC domain-containing protein n=1 Tax=Sporosarcina sp. NPDC096371 TaxID=3364530 RepID=UPI00381A9A62